MRDVNNAVTADTTVEVLPVGEGPFLQLRYVTTSTSMARQASPELQVSSISPPGS